MIIDFHTHIFPDKIAAGVISQLSSKGGITANTDGTLAGLKKSMRDGGIDASVVLPVVTNPKQFDSINTFAAEINGKDGVYSFGGIHPDNDNIEAKLDYIKSLGLKGVKIHPDYQKVFFDDERYVNIVSHCLKIGLYVTTHAGVDVGYPDPVHCTPQRIVNLLDKVGESGKPRLILAHTGSFDMWDEVERLLVGRNVYFDLAFCLDKISADRLVRIIRNHGCDKILFATDSPWADQKQYKQLFEALPLTDSEKEQIRYKNAAEILSVESFKTLTL